MKRFLRAVFVTNPYPITTGAVLGFLLVSLLLLLLAHV